MNNSIDLLYLIIICERSASPTVSTIYLSTLWPPANPHNNYSLYISSLTKSNNSDANILYPAAWQFYKTNFR